jgi:hypothetical protein
MIRTKVVACYVTIALGTAFGGWRIVKTMGQRITKLKPVGGFCAETGGAAMLFIATSLGIPVSTTHTITGAIVGVGSAQNVSAVRWGIAGNILWAWVLTIPATALVSAGLFFLLRGRLFWARRGVATPLRGHLIQLCDDIVHFRKCPVAGASLLNLGSKRGPGTFLHSCPSRGTGPRLAWPHTLSGMAHLHPELSGR